MKPVVRETDRFGDRLRGWRLILGEQDVENTAPRVTVGFACRRRWRRGHRRPLLFGYVVPGFDRLVMPDVGGRGQHMWGARRQRLGGGLGIFGLRRRRFGVVPRHRVLEVLVVVGKRIVAA